ncbi:MAG: glycosyltransferase family 2 protein [Mediterranea sp.]|jgi:glycosyltransferase involved in cell wall biosynthesis|nr:glycosyltransferase family 2 protein [Mediterranea sp.]
MIRLAIISPCYNEEAVLEWSAARLTGLLGELAQKGKVTPDSFVLYVNDGSTDHTWQLIRQLHGTHPQVKGVNLARNTGHQNAIMAGMMTAREWCDGLITIDADLQDDLSAIEAMVDAYADGYDVVYGVKVSRQADPRLKRLSAKAFYKLQQRMGIEAVYNHADFRFLSRRVLGQLARYGERNLYLRGIIPQLGFPSTTVDDVISPRTAGHSKYTLRRMLSLALDGITSFSVKPIYGILYMGAIFLCISVLIGVYVVHALITGTAEHGWASLMLSIWFVGGIILLSVGGVGLYIGKIYKEVKHRPLYSVEDILGDEKHARS